MPVQRELFDSGINNMSRPILTTTGALSVTLEREILVVNDFIEGEWSSDFPVEPYVDLIAGCTRRRFRPAPTSRRSRIPHLAELERVLAATVDGLFEDPSQLAVQAAVRRMHPAVKRDLGGYRRLVGPIVFPATTAEARDEHLCYFRDAMPPLEAAVRRAEEQPLPWA